MHAGAVRLLRKSSRVLLHLQTPTQAQHMGRWHGDQGTYQQRFLLLMLAAAGRDAWAPTQRRLGCCHAASLTLLMLPLLIWQTMCLTEMCLRSCSTRRSGGPSPM